MSNEVKRSKPTKRNKDVARADAPTYRPTAREERALNEQVRRSEAEVPAPRLGVEIDGNRMMVSVDHADQAVGFTLLKEALGSSSFDFVDGLLRQLANGMSPGESDINFALSVIKNVKPNDQIEAMLAAQMAVTHMTTMSFGGRLTRADTSEERDSAERAFNKLARTFTAQMEALKRHRTGGDQNVTVQNVSVNDGGQAIVGNVTQAPRPSNVQQPVKTMPALTDARQPEMPLLDELKGEVIPLRRGRGDDEQSPA